MEKECKFLISEESAQEQIDLFYHFGLVDTESIADERIKSALLSSLNTLRHGIRKGFLEIKVIDVDGNNTIRVIQTLSRTKDKTQTITYKEPDGKSKVYMGKVKDDNGYERSYTFLGYLSGLGIDAFEKMKGFDIKLAECLSLVFLGV